MFKREELIPTAEEILASLPLPEELKKVKAERDALASQVIRGETDKLLVIVGPCSAHESKPVLDYVERLGRLNDRVKDRLVLVPRIYTNKPRTKGVRLQGDVHPARPAQPRGYPQRHPYHPQTAHRRHRRERAVCGGRDALSRKLCLHGRSAHLYSGGRAFQRKPDAPPRRERHRPSRRHQKPDERFGARAAQFHLCGAERRAGVQISELSGAHHGQRTRSRRCCAAPSTDTATISPTSITKR